jgi:DNA-3-methyladenine glycosylase
MAPSDLRPDFESPLARDFYERDVTDVARDLLGCYLVRRRGSRIIGGRIVEVEAYGGPGDPGSHADRAPNGRARIMFGEPGILYVYFTYGMHHCMNAVTGAEGDASAVLIRALEPVWDVKAMRRGAPTNLADHLVASGPGRICRALGIDRRLNGTDLVDGPVRILPGERLEASEGVRIGLSTDDERRWRFYSDSPSVSRRVSRAGSRRPGK